MSVLPTLLVFTVPADIATSPLTFPPQHLNMHYSARLTYVRSVCAQVRVYASAQTAHFNDPKPPPPPC